MRTDGWIQNNRRDAEQPRPQLPEVMEVLRRGNAECRAMADRMQNYGLTSAPSCHDVPLVVDITPPHLSVRLGSA